MAVINTGARIGAAAVALGLSLAAPQAGVAAADSDESGGTAAVSAGPERPGSSQRAARSPGGSARPSPPESSTAGGAARRARVAASADQASPLPAAATTERRRQAPPPAATIDILPNDSAGSTATAEEPGVTAGDPPTTAVDTLQAPTPQVSVIAGKPARATSTSCGICRTLAPVTAQAVAPPAVQIAHILDGTADWLSTLPLKPVSDFLAGAVLLVRRALFPNIPYATASAVGTTSLLSGVKTWLDTFANFYPWWSGSLLPGPLQKFFLHDTPVAAPMQVELDLAKGVTSQAIPFSAYSPDGTRLIYSVPAKGMAGGPDRGTVVVDNAAGTFTYTPDTDFTGTDTFSFVASDATSLHLHAWENLFNGAFGLFNTGLDGGHRVTATVTVFNNVDIRPDPEVAEYTDIVGDFSFLTYNISGLPGLLSGAAFPRFLNTLEIGSRIGTFDIVNVQQDIAYHPFLLANTAFPDQTAPSTPSWLWPVGVPFSDGLNSFSGYYIESLNRQSWTTRPNLLSPGGFTYTRQHIPGGSSIDVYNLDASSGAPSSTQLAQLSAFIGQNSVGRAVIVAGDFGQLYSDPGQTLTQFAVANGLTDAWVELEYSGTAPTDAATCAYADSCEQPDKIFYRNAAPLDPADPATSPVLLRALEYTNEGLNFLNDAGRDLSAYRPQSVSFGYSVDAIGPMTIDPANWMADLPALSVLPLTQLPIPGTHDSGSYDVSRRSDWALTGKSQFGILTDLPGFIQNLLVKPIAAAWGKTQENSIYDQLSSGIRYLDLRLTNEPDGQIYFEHGLRSELAAVGVADIGAFANAHPKELVVVYVQGINNFTPETHAKFIAEMEAAFGSRMAPRSVGTSASLEDLWALDKNVIVVYNNAQAVAANENLWPDNTLYRPYVGVQSAPALLARNEGNLATRPPGTIWGMFGENTFNAVSLVTGVLTLGPGSNEQMAGSVIMLAGYPWNVYSPVQQWIRSDFKSSVNLVTADWYQKYWPAGNTFVRDTVGAVYETLGSRLSNQQNL